MSWLCPPPSPKGLQEEGQGQPQHPRDMPRAFASAAPSWEAWLEARGEAACAHPRGTSGKRGKFGKFVFISIYCHWGGGGSGALLFPYRCGMRPQTAGAAPPAPWGCQGPARVAVSPCGGSGRPSCQRGGALLKASGEAETRWAPSRWWLKHRGGGVLVNPLTPAAGE